MFTPEPPRRRKNIAEDDGQPLTIDTTPSGYGRLAGRVAIVAGGAGGIGRAISHLFVSEGAHVIVADLPESDGKHVAESLGHVAEFVPVDILNPEDWTQANNACQVHFGAPADLLVIASGVMVTAPVDTASQEQMRRAYDINVVGPMLGIQAVAPNMRANGYGSIVVISSMGGVTFGVAGLAPYAASKAALSALVQCAALDFGQSGIRINSILPGQIDTPMSRGSGVSADPSMFAHMPIPRSGQPRDIARAALFLASDESSWITGTHMLVDGGMDAGPSL